MNAVLEAVMRKQRGHWGLVEVLDESTRAEDLLSALERFGLRVMQVDCTNIAELNVIKLEIELAITNALALKEKCFCILIREFHLLSLTEQCRLLSLTRALREQSCDIAVQTIVIGAWNRYRLQQNWTSIESGSPVPDQKNIYSLARSTFQETFQNLSQEGWVPGRLSTIDHIVVDAFLEFTGGDPLFIRETLAILRTAGLSLRSFQSIFDDVVVSGEVVNYTLNRLNALDESAKVKLRHMIDNQVLAISPRDPAIEDLRLAGFVELSKIGDQPTARISSAIMDGVLGRNWKIDGGGTRRSDFSHDICRPLKAINCYAYRVTLEIETLLRNWLVTSCAQSGSPNWSDPLKGIKVPGASAEVIGREVQHLTRALLQAIYPEVNFHSIETGRTNEANPSGNKAKKSMVDVVESAQEWEKRVRKNPHLRLASVALPSFWTSGSLVSIYVSVKGSVGDRLNEVFKKREELGAFLERFNTIRSAVAHNQELTVAVIEQLIKLHEEATFRLGSASRV